MLPDADDRPALASERYVDPGITLAVTGKLTVPISLVLLGSIAMNRAGVPEASVDKNDDSIAREDNVRSYGEPRKIDARVLPETQPATMKVASESHFRSTVTLAVGAHNRRYLRGGRPGVGGVTALHPIQCNGPLPVGYECEFARSPRIRRQRGVSVTLSIGGRATIPDASPGSPPAWLVVPLSGPRRSLFRCAIESRQRLTFTRHAAAF